MPSHPGKVKSDSESNVMSRVGPSRETGVVLPCATARKVVPEPISSSVRSSHPVDAVSEPPCSSHCWAWKWLQLMPLADTAGTKASSPVFHNPSYSGCRLSFTAHPDVPGSATRPLSDGTRLPRTVLR